MLQNSLKLDHFECSA